RAVQAGHPAAPPARCHRLLRMERSLGGARTSRRRGAAGRDRVVADAARSRVAAGVEGEARFAISSRSAAAACGGGPLHLEPVGVYCAGGAMTNSVGAELAPSGRQLAPPDQQSATPADLAAPATFAVAALFVLFAVVLVRTAWLCDDAYINFRTIDNFLQGYG